MKICFIGTGYVGLVSGVLFSDFGNTVYCVDNNKKKIKDLENNILPIYEPGLDEIVNKNFHAKRLVFTTNIDKAIQNSDIIFIAVGTPSVKNGQSADLSNVFKVAKTISKNLNKHKTIIGDNSFIGSNSSIVAPVEIGNSSTIAAGSVITKNVPEDALGVGRSKQTNKDNWSKKKD